MELLIQLSVEVWGRKEILLKIKFIMMHGSLVKTLIKKKIMKVLENLMYVCAFVAFCGGLYTMFLNFEWSTSDFVVLLMLYAVMGQVIKNLNDSRARDAYKFTKEN